VDVELAVAEKTDVSEVFDKTVDTMEITEEQKQALIKLNGEYIKSALNELGIS
jgi:hypothetical protein